MARRSRVGPWLLLLPIPAAAQGPPPRFADLILVGGKVFTADSLRPWAEAIAIGGEEIVAVGTTAEIHRLAGPTTRQVELGGRTVVPGFNDAHVHWGSPRPGVAFRTSGAPIPDPSLELVLDSLSALARRIPQGTWLHTAIDAAMLEDPRARRHVLDSVAPLHPVWLAANTGHGHILNTAALRALAMDDDPADPVGGFYERAGAPYPGRGRGRATGLLHEYAGWNAMRRLRSSQPDSVLVAALRRDAERAVRWGITSVQNIALGQDLSALLRAHELSALPLRVRIVPMPATEPRGRVVHQMRQEIWSSWSQPSGGELRPTVSGIKWILDGTGIERLGLLRAPYSDRPGWSGELNFPPDTLRALLREALAAGEQPVLHAIGDSTLAIVLATMATLAPDSVWRRLRPRLEHAEMLTPDLWKEAVRLGVVVVQNPTHFTDPPELLMARFGEQRVRDYQPFGSLVAAGIPLAIGSDGPMNPFVNLLFAVSHPANPREALTLEQAVVAYTRGSAYAERMESRKGTLAAGMLADLAVLSQDIFTIAHERIAETTSVLTIIGGRVIHDGWAAR